MLLTDALEPILERLHPDGQYYIGQDCGIYWRETEPNEPAEKGAEAPDWFYVPNVPPLVDGAYRKDEIYLASLDFRCAIADVYEDVDFSVLNP
jgi:hypothetical protein